MGAYNYYLKELSEKLVSDQPPQMILLPENVFPFFILDESTGRPNGYEVAGSTIGPMFDKLTDLSKKHPETTLLIGMHTEAHGERYNSLVSMFGGSIQDIYRKRVLLPIAETGRVTGWLRVLHPLSTADLDDLENASLETSAGSVFPLVCSELFVLQLASGQGSGRIFVHPGNDTVFAGELIKMRIEQIGIIRAIEENSYFVSASKGSGVRMVNPYGEVLENDALMVPR